MNSASARTHQLLDAALRLHRRGELVRAKKLYRQALDLSPDDANLMQLYGTLCHQSGDAANAVRYLGMAAERIPNHPVLLNNLGEALRAAGDLAAAEARLLAALRLRPDYAGAHNNLGLVYAALEDPAKALERFRAAVDLDPDYVEGRQNLALTLLEHGRYEAAASAFEQVLQRRPDHPSAASNLLYTLTLTPDLAPEAVFAAHRRYAPPCTASPVHRIQPPADKGAEKLRIGYVSRDFRNHAVAYFLEPVLERHDRSRVEVYCYSDVESADAVTRRMRAYGHQWRDIAGLGHERVAELIRADRIDVLVDLGGHTEKNRLPVFAAKPAPIQVTWLGYCNTTGLDGMDYRITDAVADPPQAPTPATETLLRMPAHFACFRAPEAAGEPTSTPATERGYVTYGSLHKLDKLNAQVVALWSRVLQAVPNSRLLLYRDELSDWQRRRLTAAFAAQGIDPRRLRLIRHDPREGTFFDAFGRIDVMLDSFPWSGHTLACCALWMGVPVVSLRGRSHAGRMVVSALECIGKRQWVADDPEAYVQIAGRLGADLPYLADLRRALRQQVARSALSDEAAFTAALETHLLAVWTEQTAKGADR